MIDTEIEKIVDRIGIKAYRMAQNKEELRTWEFRKNFTEELFQLFKDEHLKLIGEDEYVSGFNFEKAERSLARNNLREELRTAINKPILTPSEKRQMKNNNVSMTSLIGSSTCLRCGGTLFNTMPHYC